ncbi:MAG: hypothetical protein K2X06_11600 [Burkholderiales bacterium]|nr:hypothetical protein [Burkholderiales bacterium]
MEILRCMMSPPMFLNMDAGCADFWLRFVCCVTDRFILVVPAVMQEISWAGPESGNLRGNQ